jgi:hypothetical protein
MSNITNEFVAGPPLVVKGYWLPWQTKESVSTDLAEEADYMFTSQMTGCRFSVLTKDGAKPKVAHIAGTLSQQARGEKESKLVDEMGGTGVVKARRLSVSGNAQHGYVGQTVNPSSAFVYGVRNKETNAWSFAAQIVGEKLIPGVDLTKVAATSIKPAFTFD